MPGSVPAIFTGPFDEAKAALRALGRRILALSVQIIALDVELKALTS